MIKVAKDHEADYVLVGALTLFGNEPADCKTPLLQIPGKIIPALVPKYKARYDSSIKILMFPKEAPINLCLVDAKTALYFWGRKRENLRPLTKTKDENIQGMNGKRS